MLGVPRQVATAGVKREMSVAPSGEKILIRAVKYWIKLSKGLCGQLAFMCLNFQRMQDKGNYWFRRFSKLRDIGLHYNDTLADLNTNKIVRDVKRA